MSLITFFAHFLYTSVFLGLGFAAGVKWVELKNKKENLKVKNKS